MPKYRFDHVHVYSPDPEVAAEFYIKNFGAEKLDVRQETAEHLIVELALGDIKIMVSTPWDAEKDAYGLDHFGLITDDLDAGIAELKAKGEEFSLEKTSVPGADIAYLRGPENTAIEIVEFKHG